MCVCVGMDVAVCVYVEMDAALCVCVCRNGRWGVCMCRNGRRSVCVCVCVWEWTLRCVCVLFERDGSKLITEDFSLERKHLGPILSYPTEANRFLCGSFIELSNWAV